MWSKIPNMKGYTLVEILIVISIIAVLLSFTLAGFSNARERQAIQAAKEQILSVLQSAQKSAFTGHKDCDGTLTGIQVTFSLDTINTQALCTAGSGALTSTTIRDISFSSAPSLTFQPLQDGVVFAAGGNSANIDYLIDGNTYRVLVENPGIITYQGLQP